MGIGSCKKCTRIAPESTKEAGSNEKLISVWLLSLKDEQLLQHTIKQIEGRVDKSQICHDTNECINCIRSYSCYNIILVASSKFAGELIPQICSIRQIVSFICFNPCDNDIPLSICENNHIVGSKTRLISIIEDDLEKVRTKNKSVKLVIHEETINRLLESLSDVPLCGNETKLLIGSFSFSFRLREPNILLLYDKIPELSAKLVGSFNGRNVQARLRAELEFIVNELNNGIQMKICKVNLTEAWLLKWVDIIVKLLNMILEPIKLSGPINTISSPPINMPDKRFKKVLHARPYELHYEIYDHYIVLSSKIDFSVDDGDTPQ